jgi:hypothetical protein
LVEVFPVAFLVAFLAGFEVGFGLALGLIALKLRAREAPSEERA